MATFSLNPVNKNFIKYLLFFFSMIIIFPKSCFSEINISKIFNRIHVLNIHGKRFFLNEETDIKAGYYLSTREKPATIIFEDNTKICFSSNSSLKVLRNKDKINFRYKKGSILFSINRESKDNYNLAFFSYYLDNIKDIIILSKKNNLEIINFKKSLNIFYKNDINKIDLPSFTILELLNNGNVAKKMKILEAKNFTKNFLENCSIKLPKIKESDNKTFKTQYGCVSQNGKLVCGNKYKK